MHSASVTICASAAQSSWVTADFCCSDSALTELILILIQSFRALEWQTYDVNKSICTYFRLCTLSNNVGFADTSLGLPLSRKDLSSLSLQLCLCDSWSLHYHKMQWIDLSGFFFYCNTQHTYNKTEGFIKTIRCSLELLKWSYSGIVV